LIRSAADLNDLPGPARTASPAATTLLHGALYLAILVSPLVFFEPSPYEAACALLALACLVAGVRLDRKLLPLLALLLIFNVGGLLTLMLPRGEGSERDPAIYVAVSFYLGMTAVIYACLFSEDSLRRLVILRRAYFLAAFVASLVGMPAISACIPTPSCMAARAPPSKIRTCSGPSLCCRWSCCCRPSSVLRCGCGI
jgi:hypothetical protein